MTEQDSTFEQELTLEDVMKLEELVNNARSTIALQEELIAPALEELQKHRKNIFNLVSQIGIQINDNPASKPEVNGNTITRRLAPLGLKYTFTETADGGRLATLEEKPSKESQPILSVSVNIPSEKQNTGETSSANFERGTPQDLAEILRSVTKHTAISNGDYEKHQQLLHNFLEVLKKREQNNVHQMQHGLICDSKEVHVTSETVLTTQKYNITDKTTSNCCKIILFVDDNIKQASVTGDIATLTDYIERNKNGLEASVHPHQENAL